MLLLFEFAVWGGSEIMMTGLFSVTIKRRRVRLYQGEVTLTTLTD